MFLKPSDHASYLDISSALRDRQDWNVASLRSFIYYADISAHVYDPISGLLAIGTSQGTIALFGSPGVQCQISLREPVAVKFVQFASSLNRLVCLDANNDLHLWDLEDLLQNLPKHLGTAKFDEASALTVSPCHSHAFITLQSGVVRTYDIACLRKSPYVAPNMWSLYKEKMIASGMPDLGIPDSPFGLDAVPHPRNLNLLFVVYGGKGYRALRLGSSSSLQTPASSTSNLEKTERNSLRVYELILSPGAPGGAGYDSEDLLTHRKPSVMTMATHPSGHFFAAGYSDGSIAYWAVEDEDQPLMVRTLDDVDVDVVDAEKLDKYLPSGGLPTQGRGSKVQASARDPIFKLTWSGFSNSSDPRGGHTTLTILGGTFPDDAPGLIVHYLPPFNPPEPPATPANRPDQLPTFFRNAMRDSVVPSATYFYATNTIVQDYLLVPGNTPHFGGAYDPMSILLLCEGAGGTRILEARQFPPPTFTDKEAEPETEGDGKAVENTDVEDLLVETLRSMQMSSDPDSLALPLPLEYGRSLVDGRLTTLERDAHQALLNAPGDLHDQLELNGGIAWVDPSHATELKHAKYQPHRLLVTHHNDLTVHFADLSSQLLMGSEERIQSNFPSPLTHLKVDLNVVLTEPSVAAHLSSPQISSTYLTSESLECLIALRTGEVFVYRPKPDNYEVPMFRSSEDDELVILSHVPTHSTSKFSPHFMLAPGRGPVSAYALCDIGFLATAYADGTIYIVDMRGPRVILRYDPVENSRSRHSFALPLSRHSSSHPVGSLSWSICPLSTDPQLRVRLIAVRTTGATEIFTLTKSQIGAWSCKDSDIQTTDSVDDPIPTGSFVIDPKNGAILGATSSKLSTTISRSPTGCLWVVCGAKNAKCIVDITGDQVGKARWNTKSGLVNDVQIVEKNGSRALVAMTGAHTVYVHSLPELELLHTLLLPSTRFSSLTLDSSGDFIQWQRNTQSNAISRATYGTLFNVRRTSGLPLLDFVATKKDIPPPPQPVSMGPASILGSWFSFGQSVTGDQIDTLLGGPDRPLPTPKPRQGESGTSGSYAGYSAAGIATSVSNAQTGLYNRLQSALSERGQMLDSLQERFSDLEQGSRDMANQAKRLAAEQTTKRWFMGFG